VPGQPPPPNSTGDRAITSGSAARAAVTGADPLQAGLGRGLCVLDGVGAKGGELDGFDVAPHQLDGGEVVGVAGEPFDQEPGSGNSVTVDR
jgi:hypothetical protein